MATNLSGVLGAPGSSPGVALRGPFNLTLSGTFTGTVKLERSFDKGVTWSVVSRDSTGAEAAYGAPLSLVGDEPEWEVLYRLSCTSLSAGAIAYRLSQ